MSVHHHHSHVGAGQEGRVFWAMLLTGLFMIAEVVGGWLSGSLALIADAGHMLTDTAALALAWWAFKVARRPADRQRSYGYDRFQVLAAFINGVALLVIVAWIIFEAIHRIFEPRDVLGGPMLAIATLGLLVNFVAYWLLRGAGEGNLNVRGALLHVVGDMLGSVAAISAAVVILLTGWTPIDPILSIVVALLILKSAAGLVRHAAHILMEGAPDSLDVDELSDTLVRDIPDLSDIHHVHIWLLSSERPLLTMHARVEDISVSGPVLLEIKRQLRDRYNIEHSTIQVEDGSCADHS